MGRGQHLALAKKIDFVRQICKAYETVTYSAHIERVISFKAESKVISCDHLK